jgi:hypothetical protein
MRVRVEQALNLSSAAISLAVAFGLDHQIAAMMFAAIDVALALQVELWRKQWIQQR